MKAHLYDEDTPINDVDEAKARHIPSDPDLVAIVAGMAELKSGIDTICKKQEMPLGVSASQSLLIILNSDTVLVRT